jgi:hypothetical protein
MVRTERYSTTTVLEKIGYRSSARTKRANILMLEY